MTKPKKTRAQLDAANQRRRAARATTKAEPKASPRARAYAAHEWTPDTPAKWQERGPDGRLSERPRRGPDGRLIGW